MYNNKDEDIICVRKLISDFTTGQYPTSCWKCDAVIDHGTGIVNSSTSSDSHVFGIMLHCLSGQSFE